MVMTFRGNPLDQYVDDDDMEDEEWVTPDDLPRVLTGLREAIYNPVLPGPEDDYDLEDEEEEWRDSSVHEDEFVAHESDVEWNADVEDYEVEEEIADMLAADDAAFISDDDSDYLPDESDYLSNDELPEPGDLPN